MTASIDPILFVEAGDRRNDEPMAPPEPLPGDHRTGISSPPPNTDAARTGASNGANEGPVDADMGTCTVPCNVTSAASFQTKHIFYLS